jgi:hypothetical protein
VRAWHEDDPAAPLRARITSTLDVSRGDELVSAAAAPEDVYETVRAWLDAFLAQRAGIP